MRIQSQTAIALPSGGRVELEFPPAGFLNRAGVRSTGGGALFG